MSRLASNVESFELSEVGKIIDKNWQEIPYHYENIKLDEYAIMPNHMHGILIIDRSTDAAEGKNNRGGRADARPAFTIGDIEIWIQEEYT